MVRAMARIPQALSEEAANQLPPALADGAVLRVGHEPPAAPPAAECQRPGHVRPVAHDVGTRAPRFREAGAVRGAWRSYSEG